jgi:hypothetical protein
VSVQFEFQEKDYPAHHKDQPGRRQHMQQRTKIWGKSNGLSNDLVVGMCAASSFTKQCPADGQQECGNHRQQHTDEQVIHGVMNHVALPVHFGHVDCGLCCNCCHKNADRVAMGGTLRWGNLSASKYYRTTMANTRKSIGQDFSATEFCWPGDR